MEHIIKKIPPMPPRRIDSHKGDYGKVLVVGGSRGMVGAPSLAANAAYRSGAGLVRVATPMSIQLSIAQITICATTIPLAEDQNGLIGPGSINQIWEAMEEADVLAIGPGMGQSVYLQEVMKEVIRNCPKPTVIDADGLNNLAAVWDDSMQVHENTVLTPHPGEMKRLWRACLRHALPDDRQEQARGLAKACGGVVVLKGARTIVTDGTSTYVNSTGNPGMATGGMGDILTGIIAALAARQEEGKVIFDALNAAILGVYAHGKAGDYGAMTGSKTALMASDLLDWLGLVWAKFERKKVRKTAKKMKKHAEI